MNSKNAEKKLYLLYLYVNSFLSARNVHFSLSQDCQTTQHMALLNQFANSLMAHIYKWNIMIRTLFQMWLLLLIYSNCTELLSAAF